MKISYMNFFIALSSVISLIIVLILEELTTYQVFMIFVFILFCGYGGSMIDKELDKKNANCVNSVTEGKR